jgi:hypothetical protein
MLFQKIKQRYQQNLLDTYIKNQDIESMKEIFKNTFLKNKKINFDQMLNYLVYFSSHQKYENFFTKNLVWINSFDKDDYEYLNVFINEYFKYQKIEYYPPKEYNLFLEDIAKKYSLSKINFEMMCSYNYLYQYLISEDDTKNFHILNTSNVFFETANHLYFTHYYLTRAYIYITRSPYSLYKKYKSNNHQKQVNSLQGLLSGENLQKHYFNENGYIEENINCWSTNNSSWSNINVINTFRGTVVNYSTLENNTFDALTQVVSHLIQSGIKLNLDYDFIEGYVKNNPFPVVNWNTVSISNQEKKLINRDNLDVIIDLKHQ